MKIGIIVYPKHCYLSVFSNIFLISDVFLKCPMSLESCQKDLLIPRV